MNQSTNKLYLNAQVLLKYLLGDEETDTAITCKAANTRFATYDRDLYEAVGSLKSSNQLKAHRMVKLLEMVDIVSYSEVFGKNKPVLTHERVNELRIGAQISSTNKIEEVKDIDNFLEEISRGGSQWQK